MRGVLPHPHVDVTGWADVGADMAADAFGIVGIHIPAGGRLILLDPKYCILRAENNAVVTLTTDTATHAAFCLSAGILFPQSVMAFRKMTKHFLRIRDRSITKIAGGLFEMPQEQFVRGNDFVP